MHLKAFISSLPNSWRHYMSPWPDGEYLHISAHSPACLYLPMYGHIMTPHVTSGRSWLYCLRIEGQKMHPGKVTIRCEHISELQVRGWLEETLCRVFWCVGGVGTGVWNILTNQRPCLWSLTNEKRSRLEGGARCSASKINETHPLLLTSLRTFASEFSLGIHSSFSSPEFKTKTPDTSASLSGSSTWLNTFNVQLLTWNLVFRIIWCLTNEGKYFSLSPSVSPPSRVKISVFISHPPFLRSQELWQVNTEYNQAVTDKSHVPQIFTSRLPSQQNIFTSSKNISFFKRTIVYFSTVFDHWTSPK